jgi:hypothetical protein
MLNSSNLRSRERTGLVIAIVALAIALNPLNRQVRIWLRDVVVGGVPFWLDHLLFMVTLMVVVWGLIGFLLLGPRGLSLGKPERTREAWLAGLVSGLGLTALVMAALASLGALVFEPHAGLVWAWMTLRYRSLWPAWVSHTLADTIIDNLFKA